MVKNISKKATNKSQKLKKQSKPKQQKNIPSVFRLLLETARQMWRFKKVFAGLIIIFLILNLVFVKGLASVLDVPSLKKELQQTANLHGVELGATLVGVVVGSGNATANEIASVYQTMILIICSLAFIWLFRQTYDAKSTDKFKIKQPFYEGMTPLIKFILLLVVVGVQLLPMVIGLGIFSTVQVNGLAVTAIETLLWALLAISLALISFYLISSSLLSLIIVTLPDMTPMQAYRNANKVVKNRRWIIMRKFFVFGVLSAVIFGVILILFILSVPVLTEWIMLLLSAIILPLAIGTGYRLYRSLL